MKFSVRGLIVTLLGLLCATWVLGLVWAQAGREQMKASMGEQGLDAKVMPVNAISGYSDKDVEVVVTVVNTGKMAWGKTNYIKLGCFHQTLVDQLTNRAGHANDPQWRAEIDGVYKHDEVWLAHIKIRAPRMPGVYHFRLQMLKEGDPKGNDGWFGGIAEIVVIVPDSVVSAAKG